MSPFLKRLDTPPLIVSLLVLPDLMIPSDHPYRVLNSKSPRLLGGDIRFMLNVADPSSQSNPVLRTHVTCVELENDKRQGGHALQEWP